MCDLNMVTLNTRKPRDNVELTDVNVKLAKH